MSIVPPIMCTTDTQRYSFPCPTSLLWCVAYTVPSCSASYMVDRRTCKGKLAQQRTKFPCNQICVPHPKERVGQNPHDTTNQTPIFSIIDKTKITSYAMKNYNPPKQTTTIHPPQSYCDAADTYKDVSRQEVMRFVGILISCVAMPVSLLCCIVKSLPLLSALCMVKKEVRKREIHNHNIRLTPSNMCHTICSTSYPYQNRFQRTDASIAATHMHLPCKGHTTSLHVTMSQAAETHRRTR